MSTYRLAFLPSALKEWQKLGASIRDQLKKKLEERLRQPDVKSARLRGAPDLYKIKLRQSGYRLVYRIENAQLVVVVIAVGRRDKNKVYSAAGRRR